MKLLVYLEWGQFGFCHNLCLFRWPYSVTSRAQRAEGGGSVALALDSSSHKAAFLYICNPHCLTALPFKRKISILTWASSDYSLFCCLQPSIGSDL